MSSDAGIMPTGRTWADIIYGARRHILAVIVIIAAAVFFAFSGVSVKDIGLFLEEYSDVLKAFGFSFLVFFLAGWTVTKKLLRVPTVDYLVLDFDSFTGAIYRIPVPVLFRMQVTGGNNLVFSWRTGASFKLARRVDLENGVIETAWPHEVPVEQAAFTLSDLARREDDYRDAKIENLFLRRRSMVAAADLAKRSNQALAHDISAVLKLDELDMDAYMAGLDPLASGRTAADDIQGGEEDAEGLEPSPE